MSKTEKLAAEFIEIAKETGNHLEWEDFEEIAKEIEEEQKNKKS